MNRDEFCLSDRYLKEVTDYPVSRIVCLNYHIGKRIGFDKIEHFARWAFGCRIGQDFNVKKILKLWNKKNFSITVFDDKEGYVNSLNVMISFYGDKVRERKNLSRNISELTNYCMR